jgi:hypothetical protein
MAFKIDPDAAPLYIEIKSIHRFFKKAVENKPIDHIHRVLSSVFGSSSHSSFNGIGQNDQDNMSWQTPIQAKSIGAVFNAGLMVQINYDGNAIGVVMQDQWIYGALLPLGLKLELHSSWKQILLHTAELIKAPVQPNYTAINLWPENILIEHLGWAPEEDGSQDISSVTEHQAEVARHTMRALHLYPEMSSHAWPNVAPWLHAMQSLSAAPEDTQVFESMDNRTVDWEPWASNLKQVFLTSHSRVELPEDFVSPYLETPALVV